MLIVLLKFSSNKDQASQFMQGHKEWIERGFDEGVFCWLVVFGLIRVAGLWLITPRCRTSKTG